MDRTGGKTAERTELLEAGPRVKRVTALQLAAGRTRTTRKDRQNLQQSEG
jgi:hypothetical protein